MCSLKLERIPKQRVAYVELTGPYENWGHGLMELESWLKEQGASTTGRPIGLFYNNPLETPAEKLRSEACIPLSKDVPAEGKFKVKDLPGGEVATTTHTGPPEEYTRTYGSFLEEILRQGYKFAGPAREVFAQPRADLRPGMGIVIQQPVKKS